MTEKKIDLPQIHNQQNKLANIKAFQDGENNRNIDQQNERDDEEQNRKQQFSKNSKTHKSRSTSDKGQTSDVKKENHKEQEGQDDQNDSVNRSNVHDLSSSKILKEKKVQQDEQGIQGLEQKQTKDNLKQSISNQPLKKRITSKQLQPITFYDIICYTFVSYNRITSLLYLDAPYFYRSLKVLTTITQIYCMLVFTGIFTIEMNTLSDGPKILILLLIMRPIQVLFIIIFSRNMQKSKTVYKNIFATIFSALILSGCHIMALHMTHDQSNDDLKRWQKCFIVILIMELLAIDFVALPFVISLYIKCSKNSRFHLSPVFRKI